MDGSAAGSASLGSPKKFDLPGLALPALNSVQARIRRLTLQRNVAGDFGFTIRRTQSRLNTNSPVVFAEPCEVRAGPPRPSDIVAGLLPGDELLEVNSKRVNEMTREQLLAEIRNAGNSIELVVRTVPEFSELSSTRKGNFDDSLLLDAPEGESSASSSIPEDLKYWLIHKEGYSACQFVESLPDGKVRIKVAGRELTVESSDIDRANPHALDRTDDLGNLRYLNETSGIHLLRQRYGSTLQYMNAGSQVLGCLPTDNDCAANDNLAKLFRGCRRNQMPAHIYATAQQVYRNIQMNAKSQSVILKGVSGSGKTAQLRNFMHYLCGVAGWTNALTYDTLSAVLGILEAFGNCATRLNKNSSRFLNLLSFGFDNSAALRAAKVQTFLLETIRVTKRPEKESNFHVFYYIWEGADQELRAKLKLDAVTHPIIKPFREEDDKEVAREGWRKLLEAMDMVNISAEERDAICNILGAIIHLCCADSTPTVASKANFLRATNAEIAASLLGVPFESLYQSVFRGKAFSSANGAKKSSLNRFSMSNRVEDGPQALNNFVQMLYRHLFVSITALINRQISSGSNLTWINMLDCPGSNFNLNWTQEYQWKPSSLTDLIYNYANERLSELFHDSNFRDLAQLYESEQVEVDVEQPISSPHALNRLFDQKQHLLNSTDINKRSAEKRGLLWILEEEAMFPGASDEALLERIFVHLGDSHLVTRCSEAKQFSVLHGMKAFNVRYSVDGWVKQAQPSSARDSLQSLLSSSSSSVIASYASMQMSYVESEAKLRRLTHSIQTLESAARTESSRVTGFCSGVLMQLDYIISSINRAERVHFVYCVQPYTTADFAGCDSLAMDVPYVRQQLRSILLIDAVRSHNRGYAERISFRDFRRRFQCLVPQELISAMLDDRSATMKILESMNIREHRYRLGISQALLRSDVLTELEDCRDLGLSGVIVDFQQACRQHLARRWLAKRRIQEVAIKCIQRNANAYMKIREWPWWKLFNRVVPILPTAREDEVHRSLKERLQKLEAENAALIQEKSRWQSKLVEVEENLKSEQDSVQSLSAALNRELEQRSRIENELQKRVFNCETSEQKVKSVASTNVGWEEDERTTIMRKELEQLREVNENLMVKWQKANAMMNDLEETASNLNDKNASLEKLQKGHDQKLNAMQAEIEESQIHYRKHQETADALQRKVNSLSVEIQELKNTNSDLRSTVSRYRKDLDGALDESSSSNSTLVAQKLKLDYEDKLRQKEEEMEDLQDERDSLQQTVSQLRLNAERVNRDHQRALEDRDKEFEELRAVMQRKIRALEEECGVLNDRNSTLLKQNRLFEETVRENGQKLSRASTDSGDYSYKEEYRKTMILLRDAQSMLQHEREIAPKKTLIRQLQQQIEDAELNAINAAKGRHLLESDLYEARTQLDELKRLKASLEGKLKVALKEKTAATTSADELDEQLQELISKHRELAQQCTEKFITIADQIEEINHLEKSHGLLKKELQDVSLSFDQHRASSIEKHKYILLEQKLRDLETKLEIECAQRSRFEIKTIRLDEEIDALQANLDNATVAAEKELQANRKLKKEIETMKEDLEDVQRKEADYQAKYKSEKSEKENLEYELKNTNAQLRLLQSRVENLRGELRSADSHSDLSRSSATSRCSNYPDMNGSCPSLP